jgi:predicted phosphoadenosine phosphosulfate sulfurtransferase
MPTQSYASKKTVLEAARERMAFIFDSFETVICSVSGGKDSTVLAHLALVEAHRRGRRVGMFLLDEEALYQSSVEQVDYLMQLFPENTIRLWLQVEFRLTNATTFADGGQLVCWEAGKHKEWMRPKKPWAIQHAPWDRATETVRDRRKGFGFYDAIENFERCYPGAAFLVGLRAAGESPNRWRAVTRNPVEIGGRPVYWGTRKGATTALYPLYDWNFHDIWHYIADEGLRYSKIYDFQWRKGYPITEMRVSSLIHERSFKSLCDLPEFEPKTYARLLKRVKGIALAQETAKSAKLFRATKLPKNFTSWIAYRDFLLATHPDEEHKPVFVARFARQLNNEFVARQQVRQLVLNDFENNLPVESKPDPREALIRYYDEVL